MTQAEQAPPKDSTSECIDAKGYADQSTQQTFNFPIHPDFVFVAQPPTHPPNDKTRSSRALSWIGARPRLVFFQSSPDAIGIHIFFAVVFKSRWGTGGTDSKTDFAVILFVGMIVHGLLAEILNRSPKLILDNANYVKKVVFPIEVLPAISICVALFHATISLAVLLVAFLIFNGFIQWTAIFIPLVILPLVILSLGAAWFLASLGVYLRDVAQTIGLFTTVLMFLSPVFYPVTSLPEAVRPWLMINPLTFIIEQAREVMIWGKLPDFQGLAIYTLCAVFIAWLGYIWFQKTRKGFADVL